MIEFAADERGDWLFHCHLLYHMESGMARVVRYEGFDPGPGLAGRRAHEDHWHLWGDADLLTSMTAGTVTAANTRTILAVGWEAGWGHGQRSGWEWLATAERSVNSFFSFFAGVDSLGEGTTTDATRGVAGVRRIANHVLLRDDPRRRLRSAASAP